MDNNPFLSTGSSVINWTWSGCFHLIKEWCHIWTPHWFLTIPLDLYDSLVGCWQQHQWSEQLWGKSVHAGAIYNIYSTTIDTMSLLTVGVHLMNLADTNCWDNSVLTVLSLISVCLEDLWPMNQSILPLWVWICMYIYFRQPLVIQHGWEFPLLGFFQVVHLQLVAYFQPEP